MPIFSPDIYTTASAGTTLAFVNISGAMLRDRLNTAACFL